MDKNKPLLKVVIFIIVLIVMGLFIKSYLSDGKEYQANTPAQRSTDNTPFNNTECIVDISGEVNNPGVYSVDGKMTVDQAIAVAGGYTDSADTEAINRAERVHDGMKIIVRKAEDDAYMDIYKDILDK